MEMTLGERILQARTEKRWTRRQLADASGVPYPTLAGLENSDQLSSTATPALAQALGVHALWLSTGKGPKWLADSAMTAAREPNGTRELPSQSLSLDPEMLHEALMLLVHDEAQAGPYTPRARTMRLADLYTRVVADGGRLTKEHNEQYSAEVKARAEGVTGGIELARVGSTKKRDRGRK